MPAGGRLAPVARAFLRTRYCKLARPAQECAPWQGFLPRSSDLGEFAADVPLRNALEAVQTRLAPLIEKLDDTTAAVSTDARNAALAVHPCARQSGSGSGLGELIDLMGQRCARRRRPPPSDAP